MQKIAVLVLRAVALGTSVGMIALALLQKITVESGVLLLGVGQACLALSMLQTFEKPRKDD